MRIRNLVAVAGIAVAAVAGSTLPAEAGHPLLAAFTGTAATTGTWAPASPFCGSTPCPSANSWNFASTTDVGVPYGVGSGRVTGSGTFNGWCGRSQGAGTFTLFGVSGNVSWQSAGTVIVLTGTATGYTTPVVAVVAARAASGTGNCVTAPATNFDVVGVALLGV